MAELHELLGGPATQAVTPPPGALAPLPGSLTPPPSSLTPVRTGRELSDVLTRDENDRLSQSVQIGSDMAPDKTARILKAREQSGLPQAFIEQNLDEVEKQTASARFSPEKFKRENPQFASWLAKDPTNVAVARDDVQAMSAMERALWSAKAAGSALALSVPRAGAGTLGALRWVADTLSFLDTKRPAWQQQGLATQLSKELGALQERANEAVKTASPDLSQVSPTERAVYGGVGSIGAMLQMAPAMLLTRNPWAIVAPVGVQQFGESYGGAREENAGYLRSTAKASLDAAAEVVFERWGVGGIISDVGLKKSYLTTLRNWMLKEGLGEQATTLWQDFNDWAILNPEKPFKEFYVDQRIPRAWETFVSTVVAGGGMAAIGKSLHTAMGKQNPAETEAVFRALGEASADSKLRQRVPERFRDFVNEATKDGPVTHVYVPVRQWNALFQENARQAATEVLGDAKQYDEALNVTEGDLVIPLGQYAEKIAGAPIHEELIPDLRFRQGDLSAREYAEIQASADDILGLQEERATAEFEAQRPIEEVRKQAYDMARQSMGESEAQRVADTYVARHQARAERLGTDPLELFDTEGPRIQRAVQPDIVVEDVGLMQGEPLERGAAKYKGIGRTLRMEGKRIVGLHPATTSTDVANLGLDIENLIKQAPEGAQWYDRSGEAILRHTKGDTTLAERLAQVIAITSDGASVKAGFTTAKKALEQYARGAPIKVGKPAVNANLNRLLYFGVPWDARKTSTFYLNIMQAMRLAPQSGESTQDRHMVRIAQERGILTEQNVDGISAQTYDVLEQITRAVAERMNLTPYQAQAAAWVARKTGSLIEQWARNKQHLKLSDQERFERARKDALVDYKHLLDAAELTPPGGMERTLAAIESTTKQLFAEAIPSQSLPAGQGAAALPFAERLALTRKILDALGSHKKLREQYRSAIGDLYGLKENQITFEIGTGAYTPEGGKPDVNPTIAIRVTSDVPKETVEQVVAAFQYVLRQDAVPYLRMDKNLAKDENAVGAVVFSTSSPLTMTQDRELYAKLAAYNPGFAFTRFEDGRYLVANFTELGSGEFYKLLYEFVEKDGPQFGITGATDYGVSDNGYPTHNWADDPRGTGTLDQASAGRRPVVRKRLLDLHKQVAGIVSAAVERRQGAGPLYQSTGVGGRLHGAEVRQAQALGGRIGHPGPVQYKEVDVPAAQAIARAYEKLPAVGGRPAKLAYAAFAQDVDKQFETASSVIKIEPWRQEGQPYKNSAEMRADVLKNNHLYVFEGGGPHPFLTQEQNYRFRAIHDIYGHALTGFEFGPRGEYNATRAHARMFSEKAVPAMVAETLGQNSWVNFGPHANLPVLERPYAEQKAALLPVNLWRHLLADDVSPLYQPFDTALERNAKQIDRYMEAVDMWQDLALADDLFRYPVIKSRELKDIVRQINPKYRLVHKYSERDENGIVMFDSWAIELPVAGEVVPDLAFLTRDLNDVHIDVAGLTSGRSEGAAIYQIASTYAHNNGLVFVGDPGGITDKGMQRRVEHMLSSALKFGTTTHLRAHPKMNLPWREGDDRFNIASLVRRSYENTILDVPEVDRIVYNQQAQRFENVTNGRPITDEAFKKLATKRSAGGRAPIGSATIKRAALVNTVLREASGDVSTGRPGLLAGTGQPSDGSASSVPGGLRGIFYQPSAQRKVYRGSFIGFEAGEFPTITLFQAANPSTIIHELSHSWVEELRRDAAYAAEQLAVGVTENRANFEQLVRDWETIKGYLGVTTLREDEVIPVEAHERFARSGEAYLREGKAPSLELRGIFARFKDWLVRIYKSVTELDVELTDEVRGVFDRLLATDEQIAAAREEAGLTIQAIPLEAMTPAEAAELGRIAVEAKTEAEEHVRVQLFNELIRERQDWWKNEKARVTAEVTAETDQQPVYAALGWLRSGKLPEGSPLAGAAPQKLSTEALRAVGVDIKALPPFIYQAEGGLHPDVVAEMFGFTSGQELLQELISAPPRASVIKAEVDRAMMERHGDTLNDGALAERAAEAVHGDRQADVLLAELRILTRLGAKGKVVPARAMKDLATRMVAAKTIGELRPKYYEATGARLAREAERAMITDDFDAAFTAKVRQLMNLYLFREASKKKQAIDKAIKAWRVFDRSDERLAKTRDLNLVNAGRAVLSNYGIGSTDQGPIDYLGLVAEYDPDTFADLQEKIALVTSESKPYTELTLAEFEQVKDTVDGLWSLSRQTQQMLIEGRRVSRETAREELNARIAEVGHAPQRLGYDKAISKWQAFNIKLLDWRAALRRTEHWVTAMDGASNGVFRKYIWQPITDAADSYRAARKTTLEKYLELTKTLDGRITADKIDAPELGYQFGNNGSGRAELLGALMHTGNESNLAKLLVGRGWGELQEDGTLGRSRWDAFIKRMWDTGVLTKQDYDFVQGVWDLMEAQKPAAQKAHKEMYGYYFSEVTTNEVVTPFGTYRGGYFPAVVDPMLVPEGQLRDDQQALTGQQNSFMFPTTGRGFTKARAEGYRKALQLDLRYVPQHLDKVLRFTHIEPRVKEVGRLVNDKEFRAELASRVDSEVASEMLIPWLQRAATQSVETASTSRSMRALDGVFRELRSRTGAQIMVGNVTNALQQFTGLSSAAVQVKPKNLRNALFAYISGPSALAEEIAEKSAFMRNRTTAAAMEVQKEIDNILLNPTKYEKARAFATRHGYFLQTGTQNIVDIIAWRGAYSQAIEEGAEERIAIRRADSVVRQTQGTFAAEDLSRFETGSATMRAFTMFYSYFNTQANLLGTEFANVVRATGFSAPGRLFYIYIMGVMLPAVIAEAITQAMSGEMWDDDDDDGYLDTFLSIFFGGQGKFATAMVPGVGPAVMAGVNMWNDKWYDDRMSTSPVVSVLESVARTPVSVYKALSEEHDGSWKRAIKDALTTVGIATGLPLAVLGRPLGYAADVAQGRVEPANTADYIRGLISGRATQ